MFTSHKSKYGRLREMRKTTKSRDFKTISGALRDSKPQQKRTQITTDTLRIKQDGKN